MSAEPAYATARNPKNPSFGKRVAAVAAHLGTPLMPWQRTVADVITELDPANPGAWRYPLVVISVPRQAGKTALLRALLVDRMMCYRKHEILMTAQTGKDARKRWKQITTALDSKKKKNYFRTYESRGGEELEYLPTGSFIAPFAPTPKSIHGDSLHCVAVDEAWAFDADAGHDLETAIMPTQLTVKDSQLIVVSTKGTTDSAYLNQLIGRGRQAVQDPASQMAYFEWSADPHLTAEDPYSDECLAFHPAIGHTQNAEKIRALASGDLSAWKRSILNLDAEASEQSGPVNLAIWDSLAAAEAPEPPAPANVSIAFDIAHDGSAATVAAAWLDHDGATIVRVLYSAPRTDWLPDFLTRVEHSGYAGTFADDSGPARTMTADLKETVTITALMPREYASACQLFIDRVRQGELIHDAQATIKEQLKATAVRPMGGAVAFDPNRSNGPIDMVRAVAIAVWAANQHKPQALQLFIGGMA